MSSLQTDKAVCVNPVYLSLWAVCVITSSWGTNCYVACHQFVASNLFSFLAYFSRSAYSQVWPPAFGYFLVCCLFVFVFNFKLRCIIGMTAISNHYSSNIKYCWAYLCLNSEISTSWLKTRKNSKLSTVVNQINS